MISLQSKLELVTQINQLLSFTNINCFSDETLWNFSKYILSNNSTSAISYMKIDHCFTIFRLTSLNYPQNRVLSSFLVRHPDPLKVTLLNYRPRSAMYLLSDK